MTLKSKGSETGAATITGLPFAPATFSEYTSACGFADFNLGVGYTSVFAGVKGALGNILLARSGDNKIFDSTTPAPSYIYINTYYNIIILTILT